MPIHFLRISKTGTTAMAHGLKRAGRSHETRFGPIIRGGHKVTLENVPPDEHVLFSVRDPVDRFMSGFYSRLRKGQPRYLSEWTNREVATFGRYQSPQALASALADGDERAAKAMNSIRHTRWHQSRWLISSDYLKQRLDTVVYIAHQETLDTDWEAICDLLDLPDTSRELPKDPVDAHRGLPDEDRALDDRSRKAIEDWYRDDYEILEVCERFRRWMRSS